VVKGTSLRRRLSWVEWEELLTPDVVIELVGPNTAARDRGEKMDVYARSLKVSEYYLYNPLRGERTGFQLTPGGLYVAMSTDADGCLP
jgi:Uma2 family endonuclease